MWKCASRSLKATFRRSVLSTKAPQNRVLEPLRQNGLLKLTPTVIEHCNQLYNACKQTYENFVRGKKDRERPKEKTWFSVVFDSDFFCALKWGGVFALGYSYVQYKVKILHCLEPKRDKFYTSARYHRSLGYLIDTVGIRPLNYVIPAVQAAKSKNGRQHFTDLTSQNFKSDEANFSALEKAYQKVLGALSNRLGTQCMQSGQHKEALEYFIQSAEEDHAPGIFNLGICHEKGLGTSQDFKRAAELYQRAANLGHATAMYNLGVFYAQGKGVSEADVNQARELFKAAASLGQIDAMKALKLEKQVTEEIPETHLISNNEESDKNTLSQLIFGELLNQQSLNSFKNFIITGDDEVKSSCDSIKFSEGKEIISSLGSDSGVLDLSPQSEQQYVLIG